MNRDLTLKSYLSIMAVMFPLTAVMIFGGLALLYYLPAADAVKIPITIGCMVGLAAAADPLLRRGHQWT